MNLTSMKSSHSFTELFVQNKSALTIEKTHNIFDLFTLNIFHYFK